MNEVSFFVPGIPRPGGSKRAFINKYTGRAVITEDCKRSKDWRTAVGFAAADEIKNPIMGPLKVEFTFLLPRPKGHYGTGRNAGQVKSSAPMYPAVIPDVTKLIRSTEDALKGIAWKDDSQIVNQVGIKRYSDSPGALISITPLERAAWQDMVHG